MGIVMVLEPWSVDHGISRERPPPVDSSLSQDQPSWYDPLGQHTDTVYFVMILLASRMNKNGEENKKGEFENVVDDAARRGMKLSEKIGRKVSRG
ncbi:hypothetical protein M0804_010686 [Polistes exclamans]|nr:hypothetical protein M0804_010686 [Polistes exclamans]